MLGNGRVLRLVRSEPARSVNVLIPVWSPHTVFRSSAWGPGQHRRVERYADPPTKLAEDGSRVAQHLARIENDRLLPQSSQGVQELDLNVDTGVDESRLGELIDERGQNFFRVADEKHVDRLAKERRVQPAQVMRHLLEEEHWTIARAQDDPLDHLLAVVLLSGQDGVAAGMSHAAGRQVVSVQRFVDDSRVSALRERVHQCSRNVSRSRPKAQPDLGVRAHRVVPPQDVIVWDSAGCRFFIVGQLCQ